MDAPRYFWYNILLYTFVFHILWALNFSWLLVLNVYKEKKKEIWLRPMTKTPTPTENSKTNGQHKNATKNFDFITITDRLGTVSLSNNSHQTGVVKPVYGYPTFSLTAKAV